MWKNTLLRLFVGAYIGRSICRNAMYSVMPLTVISYKTGMKLITYVRKCCGPSVLSSEPVPPTSARVPLAIA